MQGCDCSPVEIISKLNPLPPALLIAKLRRSNQHLNWAPTLQRRVRSAEIRRQLLLVSDWRDTVYALKVSVRRAMKDKPVEAREAIIAELKQMLRLKVWHPVHYSNLSVAARKAILRTSMFLKEKFTADGLFEKLKARLVAGGDQQDKELYENLSSPTAATSSVMVVAAIAAAERRQVMTIDVGGALLNVVITTTGINVHVRLDSVMTKMLVEIAPEYQRYVDDRGTMSLRPPPSGSTI